MVSGFVIVSRGRNMPKTNAQIEQRTYSEQFFGWCDLLLESLHDGDNGLCWLLCGYGLLQRLNAQLKFALVHHGCGLEWSRGR
jgi:hypothetical protein